MAEQTGRGAGDTPAGDRTPTAAETPPGSRHKGRRRRLALAGSMVAIAAGAAAVLVTRAGFGCWREGPPDARPADLAPDPPPGTRADLLEGYWEGSWSSRTSDTGEKLRCQVRRQDDGAYQADFDAAFAKVFSHKSSVLLRVRKDGPKWYFEGEKDLGWLSGGVYTYKGHATADEFYSTYDSRFDRGIFRMTRPQPPATTQPGE